MHCQTGFNCWCPQNAWIRLTPCSWNCAITSACQSGVWSAYFKQHGSKLLIIKKYTQCTSREWKFNWEALWGIWSLRGDVHQLIPVLVASLPVLVASLPGLVASLLGLYWPLPQVYIDLSLRSNDLYSGLSPRSSDLPPRSNDLCPGRLAWHKGIFSGTLASFPSPLCSFPSLACVQKSRGSLVSFLTHSNNYGTSTKYQCVAAFKCERCA